MSVPVPCYHTWMNAALLSQRCCLPTAVSEYKEYREKIFPALDPLPLLILSTDVTLAFVVLVYVWISHTVQSYWRCISGPMWHVRLRKIPFAFSYAPLLYRLEEVFPLLHNPGQRQGTRYSLKQF
jgi:hypothetical protein